MANLYSDYQVNHRSKRPLAFFPDATVQSINNFTVYSILKTQLLKNNSYFTGHARSFFTPPQDLARGEPD